MQDEFERLIRKVYQNWKSNQPKIPEGHPDEETLACFIEGRLEREENEQMRAHLMSCNDCVEAFALSIGIDAGEIKETPPELLSRVKHLLASVDKPFILEIALRFKEMALELLNTSGDVLVGQELVPAPVLRSRLIKDFKDEVTILKDFKDLRVEVRIENKAGEAFNLMIRVKQKQTQNIIKDLRVTLLKDAVELESYLTESGSVTFEHILLGSYIVQISAIDRKLASVLLDIKV